MIVWYISSGKVFDEAVIESLKNTALGLVEVLDQLEFLTKFTGLCMESSSRKFQLSIVMDVDCTIGMQSLLKAIERMGKRRLSGFKIIALASLTTWGGILKDGSVDVSLESFRSRVPLASAFPQFALENALLSAAFRNEFTLCIIGFGLFYGNNGIDLKDIFSFIWGKEAAAATEDHDGGIPSQLLLPCDVDTCVPIINIARFVETILSALGSSDRLPRFIAAVDSSIRTADGQKLSFHEIVSAIDKNINDLAVSSIVTKSGPPPEPAPPSASSPMQQSSSSSSSSSPPRPLWQCDLPFSSPATTGANVTPNLNLLDSIDQVWEEFLQCNRLAPIAVAVAGPPRTGKSDLAAMVAKKLQVEHVTPESSIRFLHRLELGGSNSANTDVFRQAKDELKVAVEAKVNEGKKPGKGPAAAAAAEEGSVDEAIFTAAFCLTLPPELVRKAIAAQVSLHASCRRRGFVLDAWDGRAITDAGTLSSVLSVQGGPESLSQSQSQAPRHLELLVELQCPPNFPVDKLVSSQGAQAKTKESQAAVKALEALLSAYNANLVPLEETETTAEHSAASTAEEEGHYLHLKTGHKGVVEIATASSSCHLPCLVHRINVVEAVEGQALADIAHAVVQAALKVKGGCIGWLTAPNPSADAPRRESVNTAMGSAAASSASSAVACGSEEDKLDADLKALAVVPKAQDVLAQQLQQLEGDRLKALSNKAAKLQAFLSATVLPQVTEGLVRIQREQPEDPIMFLAQQLMQHSADRNSQAEDRALVRFMELLHQGSACL